MPTSPANSATKPAGSNPMGRRSLVKPDIPSIYKATLIVKRDGKKLLTISTVMPENFGFGLSTNFDNPFNQPISDIAGRGSQAISTVAKGVTALTGMTTFNKYLSGAVWTGGSLFTLDLPFVLQAYSNPKTEVLDKMKKLMQSVAPSEIGGMLLAPGPHISPDGLESGALGGDDITVKIGKFFVLNPCIITNVQESFDTQFDHNGDPIGAVINVTVISFFTVTKEDLDEWFKSSLDTRYEGDDGIAQDTVNAISSVASGLRNLVFGGG